MSPPYVGFSQLFVSLTNERPLFRWAYKNDGLWCHTGSFDVASLSGVREGLTFFFFAQRFFHCRPSRVSVSHLVLSRCRPEGELIVSFMVLRGRFQRAGSGLLL